MTPDQFKDLIGANARWFAMGRTDWAGLTRTVKASSNLQIALVEFGLMLQVVGSDAMTGSQSRQQTQMQLFKQGE